MGKVLFILFAALVLVLIAVIVAKVMDKESGEKLKEDFNRSLEEYKKNKESKK